MNEAFQGFIVSAILQNKVKGSGTTNGTWTNAGTISGAFTQSVGTKTIANGADVSIINGQFHYEGSTVITAKQRMLISGVFYQVLYVQNQTDLETSATVQVCSLKRLA